MDRARVTLKPTLDDLNKGDPHLLEMIRFVRFLVDRESPHEVAQNAALAYLALITAFQQAGLVEPEWVPVLSIDVGAVEYDLCVDQTRSMMDIDSEASRGRFTCESLSQTSAEEDVKGDGQVIFKESKLTLLLESILCRGEPISAPSPPSRRSVGPSVVEDPVLAIVERMQELDLLDRQAQRISVAINLCYHSIGEAYRSFAKTVEIPPLLARSDRTREAHILQVMWSQIPLHATDATFRARVQKRLQRARKFACLVDLLGRHVLYMAPEVSVSRVDVIKLGDLQKMALGSAERSNVLKIKEKLARIMPVE